MNTAAFVNLQPYLDILYRHRKAGSCVLAVGIVLTVATVAFLPRTYTSSALLALSPAALSPQQRTGAGIDLKTRLERLKHDGLTAEHLGAIIEACGLYARQRRRGVPLEDLANNMKKHIGVAGAAAENEPDWGTVRVSFHSTDRHTTQRVVQGLVHLFVAEDWGHEKARASKAVEFFRDQAAASGAALNAKADEVKSFKYRYRGSLPEDLEVNLKTLADLQAELERTTDSRDALEERRMQLDRSLAGALQQAITIPSTTGPTTWSSPQAALAALRMQLTVLRAKYSEQYPDVLQLEAEIAALKKRFGDLNNDGAAAVPDSPVYAELRRQRGAIFAEEARLNGKITQLQAEIRDDRERIHATSIHEQQLAALTRDSAVLTAHYEELLRRLLAAKTYQSLVARHEGESFRLIEAASFARGGGSPSNLVIVPVGLILSILGALAIPFGLFLTDGSVKDAADLDEYGLSVKVSIPNICEMEPAQNRVLGAVRMLVLSSGGLCVGLGALWLYVRFVF